MIHAEAHGDYWLVDLGSSNGSYLNNRRIIQPCRLRHGDVIEIAGQTYRFQLRNADAPSQSEGTAEGTIQDIRSIDCWMLVADLEDSTQLLHRLPAEQLPSLTGGWLRTCREVIERHKGTINKFLGDGFFAYWEANDAATERLANTISALESLQSTSALRFRFVTHLGKIFAGGGASMGEESLMGSEVHFVFRMEKLAGSLGQATLLSEKANSQLNSRILTKEVGLHPLSGFDGAFRFFTISRQPEPQAR
jgi:class 3 adenylate cyclase